MCTVIRNGFKPTACINITATNPYDSWWTWEDIDTFLSLAHVQESLASLSMSSAHEKICEI